MKKSQLTKIRMLLRRIPAERYPTIMNFLYWINNSDDVLTEEEISGIKKGLREKGGISWEKLRQNV
mgnify:FL=1